MAALRSALAVLSRGYSGSSAVAYLGGRGLEINQVFRHASPPLLPAAPPLHPPPPPLLPAAIRNLGCRRFSTGVREPADKAESGLGMWWQRVRNRVKNADLEERARAMLVYTVFVMGTPIVYTVKMTEDLSRK